MAEIEDKSILEAIDSLYSKGPKQWLEEHSPFIDGMQNTASDDNMFQRFGLHLMIDGYGGDPQRLADASLLNGALDHLPTSLSMTVIHPPVIEQVGPNNKKDPGGISGFVMIAESHIAFHTFPARGFFSADVYTCQDELETANIVAFCQNLFKTQTHDVYIQSRGLRYPVKNQD